MALYRYQKKDANSGPHPGYKLSISQTLPLVLVLGGVVIMGYLLIFYASWMVAFLEGGSSPLPNPLISATNSWQSLKENLGSKVLGSQAANKLIYRQFVITIPALKVEGAVVTTNVNSSKKEAYLPILEESLAHYKGTSLPGQEGDVFIYGHSVLPQFFNKNDYLTIFSTLHKLRDGDLVEVEYGKDKFVYRVNGKRVVDPDQIEAVNRTGLGRKTMTLMTCSPPGTVLKRLLVSAELVETE